jgi:hypothetical protein
MADKTEAEKLFGACHIEPKRIAEYIKNPKLTETLTTVLKEVYSSNFNCDLFIRLKMFMELI